MNTIHHKIHEMYIICVHRSVTGLLHLLIWLRVVPNRWSGSSVSIVHRHDPKLGLVYTEILDTKFG